MTTPIADLDIDAHHASGHGGLEAALLDKGLACLVQGNGVLSFPEIGPVIRAFRDAQGWTQESMAQRYGVSIRTARRWEAGATPSFDLPFRQLLAEVLAWQVLSARSARSNS